MACSTTEDDSASITAATQANDRPVALSDGLDYYRLNELLTSITEKLTTDVYGNFYIRGSHTVKDGRQTQLREVVELRDLLEANKALMERSTGVPAGEGFMEGKKGAKFTMAQLKAVVREEQQALATNCSAEFMALKDRCNATDSRLKKSEEENVALKTRCEDMEERLWKSEQANDGMKKKIRDLEQKCASSEDGLLRKYLHLGQECTQLKQQMTASESRLKDLEKSQELRVQRERSDAETRRTNGDMSGNAGNSINQTSYDDLKKRVALMKERILEVEEWQEEYSADFASLKENMEDVDTRASNAHSLAARAQSKIGQLRGGLARAEGDIEKIRGDHASVHDWVGRVADWAEGSFNAHSAKHQVLAEKSGEASAWYRDYLVPGLQ